MSHRDTTGHGTGTQLVSHIEMTGTRDTRPYKGRVPVPLVIPQKSRYPRWQRDFVPVTGRRNQQ